MSKDGCSSGTVALDRTQSAQAALANRWIQVSSKIRSLSTQRTLPVVLRPRPFAPKWEIPGRFPLGIPARVASPFSFGYLFPLAGQVATTLPCFDLLAFLRTKQRHGNPKRAMPLLVFTPSAKSGVSHVTTADARIKLKYLYPSNEG